MVYYGRYNYNYSIHGDYFIVYKQHIHHWWAPCVFFSEPTSFLREIPRAIQVWGGSPFTDFGIRWKMMGPFMAMDGIRHTHA